MIGRFARRMPVSLADLAQQYLAQPLPDISGIFSTSQAQNILDPVTEETVPGVTEQLLYPQNFQRDNNNTGLPSLNVQDYRDAIAKRQDRLNDPDKISEFIYNLIPGMKPQSIESIMSGGAQRQMNIPGITSILPDQYYGLPYGDQAFISSQMGYTDPNTGMANQDPYGINVRSAYGNYGEYSENKANELEDTLSGRLAKKYNATYDPITGMYTGKGAAEANKMTKLLREKQQFYESQKQKRNKMIQDAFDRQIIKQQQVDTGDVPTGPIGPVNKYDEVALTGGGGGRDRDDGPSGGQFDGASSRSEYESDPTSFSGSF